MRHARNAEEPSEKTPLQDLTAQLTSKVKQQLLGLKKDPRYKFIVHVSAGDNKGQGMLVGARCHWDDDSDENVSVGYKNESIFVLVQAFAVYLY